MVTNSKTTDQTGTDQANDIKCVRTHDTENLVNELAERMELSDQPGSSRDGRRSEVDAWRHSCLTRAGYKAVPTYLPPVKEEKTVTTVDDMFGDSDDDDLFS